MAWRNWKAAQWLSSLRGGDKPEAQQADAANTPDARTAASLLASEIREAHREWMHAYHRFEQAQGKDQIDYAIFAIEAAEKRYEMLLRQAKGMKARWADVKEANVG